MTSHDDFERRITAWLIEQAPLREPEGLLQRSLAQASRAWHRPGWLADLQPALNGFGATSPALRLALLLLLVGLLAVAAIGGAIVGSGGQWPLGFSAQQVGLPGRFAFASDRDGDFEIYLMNPDRSRLVQLTNDPGDDVAPSWSPGGSRIAFASNRDGDFEIYVSNADGTAQARLTEMPGDQTPAGWSPDGRQLAYSSVLGGTTSVHVVNADGSGARKVIESGDPGIAFVGGSGWMPDGNTLLIVIDRTTSGGELDIYLVRIADGRLVQLTTAPGDDGTPALSPDGSRIAFHSDRDGGCLYVMNADGTAVSQVTTGCSTGFPKAWAPDGSKIGWAGDRNKRGPADIHVVSPDGTGQAQLTDSADIVDLAWGPASP